MLVYAKRSFRASPRQLAGAIRARVAARPWPDLQQARKWLVATGQLEQAILDGGDEDRGGIASAATLAAADLFLVTRRKPDVASRIKWYAEQLLHALDHLERTSSDRELEIRVPEGFAWYALYPDSYAQTAESWARRFGFGCPEICIIGLRSIGTTLAAVVAQTLRNCGLPVTSCISLRTSGPPFSRRVELPAGFVPAAHNIIVDEGPGLSGSSMVAVARALEEAGAETECIHFFAGHGNGPGPAADENIRSWWRSSRVWNTDLDSTVVAGSLLPDALSSAVETFADEGATGLAEPLGFEGWRNLAGLESLPRAIAPRLETPKKLVRLSSGRAVLLKFAGFALTSTEIGTNERLTTRNGGIAPYGAIHGWIAMPWVEGHRLTIRDGSIQFLTNHLAPWIAASAVEAMHTEEIPDALARISAALEAWAASRDRDVPLRMFGRIAERECARARLAPQYCFGDGRLAPLEWIRTRAGEIKKADHWPHQCDHTWVGRQPIAWDLAGAETEWELDEYRAAALRECVRNLSGYSCSAETLAFYKAGYCVFRAASALSCAMTSGDEWIREHLLSACRWYEERLDAELAILATESALR